MQTIVTLCLTHCLNVWYFGWPRVRPTVYDTLARQANVTQFALAVDRTWKVGTVGTRYNGKVGTNRIIPLNGP